ncbi:hypothetical protein D3C72_2286080 [compost metagenome]
MLAGVIQRQVKKLLHFGCCFQRQLFKGHHAALLHGHVFSMLQRQIQKNACHGRNAVIHIPTPVNALEGQLQRLGIARKTLGRAAIGIARELVQHNQHRQQPQR